MIAYLYSYYFTYCLQNQMWNARKHTIAAIGRGRRATTLLVRIIARAKVDLLVMEFCVTVWLFALSIYDYYYFRIFFF